MKPDEIQKYHVEKNGPKGFFLLCKSPKTSSRLVSRFVYKSTKYWYHSYLCHNMHPNLQTYKILITFILMYLHSSNGSNIYFHESTVRFHELNVYFHESNMNLTLLKIRQPTATLKSGSSRLELYSASNCFVSLGKQYPP